MKLCDFCRFLHIFEAHGQCNLMSRKVLIDLLHTVTLARYLSFAEARCFLDICFSAHYPRYSQLQFILNQTKSSTAKYTSALFSRNYMAFSVSSAGHLDLSGALWHYKILNLNRFRLNRIYSRAENTGETVFSKRFSLCRLF